MPNKHLLSTVRYICSWAANAKLTLAAEADYVVNRNFSNSFPGHLVAAVGYESIILRMLGCCATASSTFRLAAVCLPVPPKPLKTLPLTATYQFADGFQLRGEYRGDSSNQPFFFTDTPGKLKRCQDTATLGLLYWLGGKQGSW